MKDTELEVEKVIALSRAVQKLSVAAKRFDTAVRAFENEPWNPWRWLQVTYLGFRVGQLSSTTKRLRGER